MAKTVVADRQYSDRLPNWVIRNFRWISHPITVFVILQVFLVSITAIWVIWFVDKEAEIARLAQSFGREYFDSRYAIAILIVGCVLLGMALVGTTILFVQARKQSRLVKLQRSFVSSVTHELRSPLASLQLAFETMNSRDLPEDTRRHMMNMILADIERLRRLVEQILVSARLDRGVPVFSDTVEDVQLRQIIEKVCDANKFLDRNLMNRVSIDCADELVLRAPQSAIQLILTNLLENAIKYSPADSPIEILAWSKGDESIVLAVDDHGIGLEKREQSRVFRMFHRASHASKQAIGGTGLGLFIVKSTVRFLKGRIWVESEGKNKGSTFYVELPKAKASE